MTGSVPTFSPFIWMDGTAAEAAALYTSLFKDGRIVSTSHYRSEGRGPDGGTKGAVMVVEFELAGFRMAALNAGPKFRPSPAISLFVQTSDRTEAERLWAGLSHGGRVLMPFRAHERSPLYGWVEDRFGVSWQIARDREGPASQKITPLLTFTNEVAGRAAEAMSFYGSIFANARKENSVPYPAAADTPHGAIQFAEIRLGRARLMAMDALGAHDFDFGEGLSFTIPCTDQSEIDYYWDNLVDGGGRHSQCGWLADRFGVWWQVVPEIVPALLSGSDPKRADRVAAAVMSMTKPILAEIEKAAA